MKCTEKTYGLENKVSRKHSSDESAHSPENRLYTTPTNFGLDTKYPQNMFLRSEAN